ncbi:HEAT repeat domain-containing protein [Sorangium cellulosum]|uniref:HEAT repeat domain-containing protein n=1 Tax=Sorangium cellulosum TaxID=56 RepID=A0A150QT83_SORCE|nr:HEAT repeat domain-containing protein [Sorangium cellulosum]KYF70856.1 hypothetical protein BE15_30590 [Sorangium cellulosum]
MSDAPGHAGSSSALGPGHTAARAARDAIEEALFALPDIPLAFDRVDLRDRLLQAIACVYVALDNPSIALAHLDALTQGAARAAEGRALLARLGDPAAFPPLGRAIARLDAAAASLRRGADAAAQVQLARRSELVGGRAEACPPPRPFRASTGVPQLHAPPRLPLLPDVAVDPAVPILASPTPPRVLPRPVSIAELRTLADAVATGAIAEHYVEPEPESAPVLAAADQVPLAYEPAVEEVEVLRQLARDCLDDIAIHRALRKPNAIETWLDQEPFEQRLLENLDAFAAIGGPGLPLVSLFHAEAKAPDPERAFAAALALGSIEGNDTVNAAVMMLKQSPPEELPGWYEGLWLAPSPAIDAAMADLSTSSRPELVTFALDVLHARGNISDEVVAPLLERSEPEIFRRVVRALATALPRSVAIDRLERICAATDDEDLSLIAIESLLRRGHAPAIQLLRNALDAPASASRAQRAASLLCLVGRASDLDRLLGAANAAPTASLMRSLGRFGHRDVLGTLVEALAHQDREIVAAAAESLERITAAGLRETIEEPWEVELPPGAAEAGGIPIPMRKVERIVRDPRRWAAWLRDKAPHLDGRLKIRGGALFTPLQIVDELESRITPPGAREEAALELTLVTGLHFQFSPHDWVARQRHHLSILRTRVAALKVTPGAWSYGLTREPERPALPLPSRVLGSASAPVPLSPEGDAPPWQRERESWPLEEGASMTPLARSLVPGPGHPDTTAVPGFITGHAPTQSPVFPLESVWTEGPGSYVSEDEHDDAVRTMDAFVPEVTLPFRPAERQAEEQPDPVDSEPTATITIRVDLARAMSGELLSAPRVLPFQSTGSTRSSTTREMDPPPSESAGRTLSAPLVPVASALPFRPAKSPPEQGVENTAQLSGHPLDSDTDSTMTISTPVIPSGPVMPFRRPDDGSGPPSSRSPPTVEQVHGPGSRSSPAPSPSREPASSGAETILSLAQYASLCAELAVFPWATETIFQRYGLDTGEKRHAVDAAWKERLRRDRGQYDSWQQMYRNYHDYWTKRGTPMR